MKTLLNTVVGLMAATAAASATSLFSDNFNSYQNGNLSGQGGWSLTGSDNTNPIQVNSGAVALGTGQDLYCALPGGTYALPADAASLYVGLDLNVSAATTTGDYFLHYGGAVGTTSAYMDRFYVKSAGSGSGQFLLGWAGASTGVTYGTTALSLNQTYHIVIAYDRVNGTANDTAEVYVNPSDSANQSNNTVYNSWVWAGGTETPTVAEMCLRQGGSSSAPTLTLDNLVAGTAFSDVAASPVPEPQGLAWLGGAILLAGNLIRRRG